MNDPRIGKIPLDAESRARSANALKVIAGAAHEADTAYTQHAMVCGVCEREAHVDALAPKQVLAMLEPHQKKKRVTIFCDEGRTLWQTAIERNGVLRHAKMALGDLGISPAG